MKRVSDRQISSPKDTGRSDLRADLTCGDSHGKVCGHSSIYSGDESKRVEGDGVWEDICLWLEIIPPRSP